MDVRVEKNSNPHSKSNYLARRQGILILLLSSLILFYGNSFVFAADEPSKIDSTTNVGIAAASLILQPIYLAIKLAVGITGTTMSGLTLLATGGNEELAGQIFKDSWEGPWGVPALLKPTHDSEKAKT